MSKVLIVDDDNKNIFALSATLKAKSVAHVSASSAEEAIELLHNDASIKVVLMDMMMPGTDGYEATRIIKADSELQHVKVFAVTAQAMKGDKEKCLAAGADEYISKPINVDVLMQLLNNF